MARWHASFVAVAILWQLLKGMGVTFLVLLQLAIPASLSERIFGHLSGHMAAF